MEKREYVSAHELCELLKRKCAPDYIYRQLAEECMELAQAALKVIRVKNGETPDSEDETVGNFLEEMADVCAMWDIAAKFMNEAAICKMREIRDEKHGRMHDRLKALPDKTEGRKWWRIDLEKVSEGEAKLGMTAPFIHGCGVSTEQLRKLINEWLDGKKK